MADWSLLQNQLGVSFNNLTLLQQAFVHRSYHNENPEFSLGSNERLEFLGDAVLGFVVAEELYRRFADLNEGEMTRLRSALVRQDSLARLASSLGLGDYLYLGQGEEKSGGRRRPRNLACTLEALIGAIYIDQGSPNTRDFISRLFSSGFMKVIEEGLADHKSRLQELAQSKRQEKPIYRLVEATGPDHDRRFCVDVVVEGEVLGRGWGRSKRSAEKEAARQALENMQTANGENLLTKDQTAT
jgi:ribonuclease-3